MAFFRDRAWPFFLSLLVHAGIVGLLVYGVFKFGDSPKPQPTPQLAIEAEVIDESKVREETRRLQEDEQRKKREQEQERQRAEELKREREAEEQRLDDLRKERAKEEEPERTRVEQRKDEEAERVKAAEAKAIEDDAKRKAQAKAAAEKKRKEEADRKKAADEAKAKDALKRQLAEEETQAARAPILAQYIAQIQARIQRAWIKPPTAKAGLNCVVYVTQLPGGEVSSVRVDTCNGDEIVRQSIEAAVYRASPLPLPSDPALFERNLRLNFKPDE